MSPLSSYDIERRYSIPAMEGIVTILWFAAFVAQASSLPSPEQCTSSECSSSQAAVVFGAFEWYVVP